MSNLLISTLITRASLNQKYWYTHENGALARMTWRSYTYMYLSTCCMQDCVLTLVLHNTNIQTLRPAWSDLNHNNSLNDLPNNTITHRRHRTMKDDTQSCTLWMVVCLHLRCVPASKTKSEPITTRPTRVLLWKYVLSCPVVTELCVLAWSSDFASMCQAFRLPSCSILCTRHVFSLHLSMFAHVTV